MLILHETNTYNGTSKIASGTRGKLKIGKLTVVQIGRVMK